ncbi:hypothetical protein EPN42_16120 [bacterium]|nr:MAG: hypothetical protein EPN42_16120 [bacterium]
MTDRVRHPQDVRIVPGATPASQPTPRAPSNATAVQIFRLLASQAEAGLSMPVARQADDQGSDQSGGDGNSDAHCPDPGDSANDSAMPGQAREASQPAAGASPSHSEPPHDAPARSAATSARVLSRREARAPKAPEAPEQDTALGKQIVHACAIATHGELFTRELTDRIARFCSTSGASGDASWAVTLPMNPAVLPDTLLHLQLSPSSIGIRFETQNPRSTQLISDNADALRTRLADALGRQIDVDIGT